MKIMYLNPVGISSYDDYFANTIETIKEKTTEVHVTSLNPLVGTFNNLEVRTYQALVAGDVIRAVRQAANEHFDAFVIGCFYDTALYDAREISGDMIVVAPCHSAIEIALTISNQFSVIVGKQKWVNQMHKSITEYGYDGKLSSFRVVDLGVTEFQEDHEKAYQKMIQAGKTAIEVDKAESLILGCTLESGFYLKMGKELQVPVIDPVIASLKNAEYLANLKKNFGLRPSRQWGSAAPSESELEKFNVFQSEYQFGNRIVIK